MNLKSIKFLLLSYFGIALIGSFLLSLPFSHKGHISFIDAFFTATSALTCTGLIIKDTALDFTSTGHVIILFLIQLGGFGYMTMLGLIYLLFRRRMGNAERNILKEALNHANYDDLTDFIKKILIYVFFVELIGAILLSIDFSLRFGLADGIWYGVFHAISAFNNGGFSVFPNSLIDFRTDVLVNTVICVLIFLGGIGYICLVELRFFLLNRVTKQRKHRFSLHFKIVFSVSILLIVLCAMMLLVLEWDNPETFGSFGFFERIIAAVFSSVNYRTAGFVSYDMSGLRDSSLFFSIIFMLIGGAPGGTATGIKVTTIAVLYAFARSVFTRSEVRLFNRAVSEESIQRALMVFIISGVYFLGLSLLLTLIEPKTNFFALVYEVNAAFSNVGISTGDGGILSLSASFHDAGKSLIILSMILGKAGVMIFTLALFGSAQESRIKYQKEKIIL
ncbi:potassium transporter TrkG [Helicobacter mustelae]|uniref:Putative K+ uptake protein n=1 Tax=Helicobacter mustelae (strain ATCC 43772 / CCUG 25715 / CIP 103759 / LMG 18044 / NCTC 12198 / R85-136P) TaxID=679897 RepID=D3UG98_HELM1|nr:potassium transporter TrkG [Helicobacter mustelae]CBG39519.1 putative K+ uptake protein [Helicobacter mustelae 12198]SQH71030.1 K+ uptake protein [Helicobacter mustelae]STP12159.1 K+ uptake protein [Helicobacter mustelae]